MEISPGKKQIYTVQYGDLGTKDTPRIVQEMRVRELEEGWATAFTNGSELDYKATGGFCANPNGLDKEQPDLSGDQYLGIKATYFDGELVRIALAQQGHDINGTNIVGILSHCKPAIQVAEALGICEDWEGEV